MAKDNRGPRPSERASDKAICEQADKIRSQEANDKSDFKHCVIKHSQW
jgi:hypothetical protein